MFRSRYLEYAQLVSQLEEWARRHPSFVRLASIGKTPEGRDIPILTIGRDPDAMGPAVWVDGNMHASELCGSSVAMAIAEDVIRIHEGKTGDGPQPRKPGSVPTPGSVPELPPHMADILRETLFYVVPRISPDGAEAVMKTGRYIRSSPRDERRYKGHSYWEAHDFDGNGRMGYMRQRCDDGELAELPGFPGVLVPRLPEDSPPYFRLFPEGRIVNFDGRRIPDPYFLSDNQYDFNRNFPYSWAPEHEQEGAGEFPGSAPETRAVLDFTVAHPNIFAWLNLHTFGGVLIRPLGDQPDHKMDPEDLAVFRQVEAWTRDLTGYPTVSGYHEFLYEPEKPLKGDMTDYAYHQRGCLAYVIELWDLFHQIGMEPRKPFVDVYSRLDRKDFEALAKWDRDMNRGRVFRAWQAVKHPQLGDVEVGGLDLLVGISNPPFEMLEKVCEQQSAAFLRVAALAPRVALEVKGVEKLGPGLSRIEVRVVNRGYLSTYGISSARKLKHSEPLRLTAQGEGLEVTVPGGGAAEIGHLDGWGRGLYHGINIFAPWTRGNVHERYVSILASGRGRLSIRVGSCRVGYRSVEVAVE